MDLTATRQDLFWKIIQALMVVVFLHHALQPILSLAGIFPWKAKSVLKKILKIAGALLAVILLVGGLFLAHTWYFKPVNINLFFARTMMQIMMESPELLSMVRVLEPIGING